MAYYLTTSVFEVTIVAARVVGMLRWYMASLQRNSLMEERNTALPSPSRE
jgi:hypothetical protein